MKGLIHVQIGHIYLYIGMQHQSEIWEIVSEEERHLRLEKKSLELKLQIVMLDSKCKAPFYTIVFL